RYASRRLHVSKTFGDMHCLDGLFDVVGGEIYSNELKRIEKEMFDADWAQAKARVGDDVNVTDLWRTAAQRRADAAVEMAIRSRGFPADGRRPEPLFSVLLGWDALMSICELDGGAVV